MLEQRDIKWVHLAVVAHIVLGTALMTALAMPYRQFLFGHLQAWVCAVAVPAAGAWLWLWRARRQGEQSAAIRQLLIAPLWVTFATIVCFYELIAQLSQH